MRRGEWCVVDALTGVLCAQVLRTLR